ncbi:hypothetical protein H6F86_10830 [Phormidium sp. FACHB-592]|uniref:Uncharacterized protein n=1 Tax=Stenomitos frigidus AS-A4 TaxID=2933935 RepID=A0ABV0KMZ4_9CYAN|nr:hypothetical protein [Phormidium sp. FACHB-592]MBD2074368.1 hypothetical protein [Phormidium sp. FACHB-592]
MTSENTTRNDPPFRTPNPTELKAAALEDSILDRYPHETDDDINEEHPEAKQADVVDISVSDRPVDQETSSQTVKANLSGH